MAGSAKPVLVVGSINTDLVVTTGRLPATGETVAGTTFATYQGGKGANQAVAAARLGARVMMAGMVGSDAYGPESIRQLDAQSVDCGQVGVADGASGIAVITVGGDGQNTIVVVPGANALVSEEFVEARRALIREAGMVLAQLEIPMAAVLRLAEVCEQEGVPLMLDPAPAGALPEGLLAQCAWVTPNETEAAFYAGGETGGDPETTVRALRDRGCAECRAEAGRAGGRMSRRRAGSRSP